ncbi:MAG: hypothetical protein ACTTG8_00060 [Catonella sp.]|uniref:hypothetical protein n=1 Tax=Catonella sp. TaxID=2382125 RepID=UPI003FA05A3E
MFYKLMKNEFRNIGKLLLLVNVIVLGMHLLSVVFEQIYNSGVLVGSVFDNIFGIFPGIYLLSIFAVNIIIVLVFAIRYYKKVYSVEGYLTHTLPVKKTAIYFAMLISSSIGTVITVLVSLGYPFVRIVNEILSVGTTSLDDWFKVSEEFHITGLTYFLAVLGGTLAVFAAFALIFLCISIGQNWKAHPVAGTIIVYWLITTALEITGAIGIVSLAESGIPEKIFGNYSLPGDIFNVMACWGIGLEVIGISIMSVISIVIMKKKLNL